MCGIAGAVWTDERNALSADELARMVATLRHRGPDDEGEYRSELARRPVMGDTPGVALGFRRLSIIDLAGGKQPLSNEDDTVWTVFNGEIYNYLDLRRRLEGGGHKLKTHSDTETLVHLYEDEGDAFLDKLVGMFGLALWDARRGRLILARDRLGKKPLYYRVEPNRLLFGSELKAILAAPNVPREIDAGAVDAYLAYQYVPHPHTIFQGIHKLPPGWMAVFENGRFSAAPYWKPDFTVEKRIPYKEAQAELKRLMLDAVERRMIADVPLGAFLSGGIDSSIVVALMQSVSSRPVKTFSIGFSVQEYDETPYARQVAQKLETEHHELVVEPQALEVLPRLVRHYDEPFADSSAIPTWRLAEFTRENVTVALTGDGGDELFAGYPHHFAAQIGAAFDALPSGLQKFFAAPMWQGLPTGTRQRGFVRRFKRLSEALAKSPAARQLQWMAVFGESLRADLFADEFVARLPNRDPVDFLAKAMARAKGRDAATVASLADLTTYLPGDILVKVDRASMAHGLECRCPFLDHRVVEFAAGLPIDYKLRWGRGKRILRDAFGPLLPPAILTRPKKGFGVPLEPWFRGELKDFLRETLFDPRTERRGMFRSEVVARLVGEHLERRYDHSARLWALLVLELWQREWIDDAPRSDADAITAARPAPAERGAEPDRPGPSESTSAAAR